jgi:predicted RNase H-like nuclease (RuvC/YqgF family)
MEQIPTEVMEKIENKFPVETGWNIMDTSSISRHAAIFGYRLASPCALCEGKEKEIAELNQGIKNAIDVKDEYKDMYYNAAKIIEELKAENERLRDGIEEIQHHLLGEFADTGANMCKELLTKANP